MTADLRRKFEKLDLASKEASREMTPKDKRPTTDMIVGTLPRTALPRVLLGCQTTCSGDGKITDGGYSRHTDIRDTKNPQSLTGFAGFVVSTAGWKKSGTPLTFRIRRHRVIGESPVNVRAFPVPSPFVTACLCCSEWGRKSSRTS
jgi:hypothetical protein